MNHLKEAPSPPDSHYVGIIYLYENNGVSHLMTVKDRDRQEGRVNTKLPGGSNERLYEEYMPYENYLFKILERLNFEKKGLIKILKNERNRKSVLEEYGENSSLTFILRTLVLECLKKVGYYPMDVEPEVVHVVELRGHTQYFLLIKSLIDAEGNEISAPDMTANFKALDLDIQETRVPMPLTEFKSLISSHRTAVEKYLLVKGG